MVAEGDGEANIVDGMGVGVIDGAGLEDDASGCAAVGFQKVFNRSIPP